MKLHAVRAYFIRKRNLLHHSKDSLGARFIPSFSSGHPNRIDRSCAVAISAPDQTGGFQSGDVRSSAALSKRERSPTGIKRSRVQSPDLCTRASFGSVAWHCKARQEADQSHLLRKRVSNHG